MNSITFVVDKLTPPSTQLRHPHASNTSSPTSSSRPDSGYFSIYSSDNDETDLMTRADPLLRRRKVESDAGPTEVFREKFPVPDRNARSSNIVLRGLKSLLTTLTGILWALIYPFARGYSSLKRLISRYPRHITSTHHSDPNLLHSMPPAFPAISATEGVPFRPPSSASSASEASSSGTDSDAETDISTLAPTDISEVSSMSSAPSLRRSPRLHSVSEKEELMALSRRRTADSLKSPTSPRTPSITSKTPHTSLPITTAKTAVQLIPRPLIPTKPSQKTLVLDLDETLIHSLAKGGKLGSGHMVEVKFDRVPILYFVHKRPYCDLFLRKVSKWYDVVIFTASVQEYADPVIDWLEAERKIFKARYYRQHCTVENGAYIKDLSVIQPDLASVCILDNSPISYAYHEANAIPIEGWISDPTDNDLLHLIPFLRALRFVGDVRNLLGLRNAGRNKT